MGSTFAKKKMGLIVAMDLDNGIGKGGTLPWRLRKDMAMFVKETTKVEGPNKRNAVIMGRKCWDSIPEKFRPLKGRLNVVISRTLPEVREDNLIISPNLEQVLNELNTGTIGEGIDTIWNIGGGEIYKSALDQDLVDLLVVTHIDSRFDTDVKMAPIDWSKFVEDKSLASENEQENDLSFSFRFYNRTR